MPFLFENIFSALDGSWFGQVVSGASHYLFIRLIRMNIRCGSGETWDFLKSRTVFIFSKHISNKVYTLQIVQSWLRKPNKRRGRTDGGEPAGLRSIRATCRGKRMFTCLNSCRRNLTEVASTTVTTRSEFHLWMVLNQKIMFPKFSP